MGGSGSGRHWHWDAKSTTESMSRLDVRRLSRDGLLWDGNSFRWSWRRGDEPAGSIRVIVSSDSVRLKYRSRSGGGDWKPMEYDVPILTQACHFGGHRKWFACPARGCGRRVAILYGGRVFACRHCHQLAYTSQRERDFERYLRRSNKIRKRLGWDDDWGPRPKGMHDRTFLRLLRELDYWSCRSDRQFQSYVNSRFGHLADT